MGRAILVTLVGMLASGSAWGNEGRLYLCKTEDVQELGENGRHERNMVTKQSMQLYSRFTFDEETGLLRMGSAGIIRKMKVVQKGTSENSAVGLFTYHGPGSAGADVFRIRVWEDEMPLMFVDTDSVYTGRCKPI